MEYRVLGSTGIRVSAICFGAGPVSGWMAELTPEEQQRVVRRALDVGIKWFDTAAGYGNGLSEASLGTAFARLGLPPDVHLATKVRYMPEHFADIRRHTRDSFEGSLRRLRVRQVTLLQLHNAITSRREEEPTSITPQDVLGPGGVLEAFQELRSEGRVRYLGLTGIEQAAALRAAVESGAFATRVFAAGALAGNPPSAHTLKTPFFPLALYQRDQRRAARLQKLLGLDRNLKTEAIRFVLSHSHVSAAIIGFREPWQIDEAAASLATGPLPAEVLKTLLQVAADEAHSMGESAEHGSED